MKLLKPEWVNHNAKGIFAIDVHPDSSRFATGGQGEDSGLIFIWNVAPVISEKHEADQNVPRMLCQLDDHSGCVNCLRWSNSGKYLASGGDDKLVMIWEISKTAGTSTVFGTGGTVVNIENWKCAHVLRSHTGDIIDVAWSPDDSYLATGSVDNSIIVWNAQNFPEALQTIKGHQGLVKGVVFDPVGKYLASQADDKTLCIWNVSDWSLEKRLTDPFTEASGTTHALRLNWSPDGQYVVSAHAMNNGGPVAKIIERSDWATKKDFVGHRKAVTCARFNPRMLSKIENNKANYVAAALGSRDRSLSIWLTSLNRPLAVFHDLFTNSVMDISWSKCGYFLLACSLDGTVAFFHFDEQELGRTTPIEEMYIYHKKTYGTSIKATKSLIITSVLENTDFLKHQQQQPVKEKPKQIHSQPIANNVPASPMPKTHSGQLTSHTIAKSSAEDILKMQREVTTKDGKRRIVPMLVEATPDNSLERRPSLTSTLVTSPPVEPPSQSPTVPLVTTTTNICVKRKLIEPPKKNKKKKKENTPSQETEESPVKHHLSNTFSPFYIPVPQPEKHSSIQISLHSFNEKKSEASIEVENDLQNVSGVNFIRYLREESVEWETCVESHVNNISSNKRFVCVSCMNCTIHLFSHRGMRILGALVLDSQIVELQCMDCYLLAITTNGTVSVWNIDKRKIIVDHKSILKFLKDGELEISSCTINKSGCPIITLSDHSVYTYNLDLSTWTLVWKNSAIKQAADMSSCLHECPPKGPLHTMQLPLSRMTKQVSNGLRLNHSKQKTCSLTYIEEQMFAALAMQSAYEYRYWLIAYTRSLVQTEDLSRLRCLCEQLLASSDQNISSSTRILTHEKSDLLKDILPIVASNLKFQRLYAEIQQQLETI